MERTSKTGQEWHNDAAGVAVKVDGTYWGCEGRQEEDLDGRQRF